MSVLGADLSPSSPVLPPSRFSMTIDSRLDDTLQSPLGKGYELDFAVDDVHLQRQAQYVIRHFVNYRVRMTRIGAHAGYADYTRSPNVLIRDFGNGHVKARPSAVDNGPYDTAFLLEGVARVELKGELTGANNHAEE